MGIHPIQCKLIIPLRIARTLGQVAHTTMGRTLRGRWGLWPFWANWIKFHPKVVTRKIVSPYHRKHSLWALAWMQTEALLPFCNKGWGSKRYGNIFNTSILEAHYLLENVHILAMLACIYLWAVEEHKYE